MLKHDVFFVRLRAIGEKELLAQVQCLCLYCIDTKPIADRTQEFISVYLTSLVPCVISGDAMANEQTCAKHHLVMISISISSTNCHSLATACITCYVVAIRDSRIATIPTLIDRRYKSELSMASLRPDWHYTRSAMEKRLRFWNSSCKDLFLPQQLRGVDARGAGRGNSTCRGRNGK